MLYNVQLYQEDLDYLSRLELPWKKIRGSTLMLSGSTGMLGSLLTDALLFANSKYHLDCNLILLGRARQKMADRFGFWMKSNAGSLSLLECDINQGYPDIAPDIAIDYVVHLASNTHPVAYASDPIGTITTNILGTKNLLDCAVRHHTKRFVFASSNEIYGENRGDCEWFTEDYCGYINCNTLRAGYPESKRCGEALCQAYCKQYGLDFVIPRFTRSYGPTLLPTDTKALSQFLHNAMQKQDIVLKSKGMQYYSYTYATDAISGLLTILLQGQTGEAYNIADAASDMKLLDLAQYIALLAGTKVVFDLPSEAENIGFSKVYKARLDSSKLRKLGWKANWNIQSGLERTFKIWHSATKSS